MGISDYHNKLISLIANYSQLLSIYFICPDLHPTYMYNNANHHYTIIYLEIYNISYNYYSMMRHYHLVVQKQLNFLLI